MSEISKKEKAVIYNQNVSTIAEYLFAKFYAKDPFDQYLDFQTEEIVRNRCLDKADRMYHFFENVNEIKKTMDFLNTVNPGMAKELVDSL